MSLVRFDEFELDEQNALLTRSGKVVSLTPKAFAVLCELTRQPGRLTKKDNLLDAVWGHRHVSESVLKSTISQLRAALADDASNPRFIETASRHGYRFIGRLADGAGPSAPGATPSAGATTTPTERIGDGASTPAAAPDTIAWTMDTVPVIPPEPRTPMVGRRAFVARLHEAWKRAGEGRRELVLVAGDPGVGKTTLIEHFVREANPSVVAFGQCVEQFGAGEPYLPILEALGSLCRRFPDLPVLMRTIAPTWLIQLPWLCTEEERASLNRELAGTSQERMLRELTECIGRFTQKAPLLLVTEDLHWADLATLRMMARFVRIQSPTRVLWLGSFRLTQAIAEEHPLVEIRHELRLHKLHTEFLLDSFSEDEVGEYLGARMPQTSFPDAFVLRLHSHTDGLPLFLSNVVDTLIERETAQPEAIDELIHASGTAPLPVPDSLIGALEKQITRLPAEVRAVLETGSLCGIDFRAATVAEALGQNPAAIAEQCDSLVRRKLWIRDAGLVEMPDGTLDSRYAFEHALYRRVFSQRLGVAQRVQAHRRIARSLEANRNAGLAVAPAELAAHREFGHEFPAALREYSAAAQAALSVFAPIEALNLIEHALTLLERCPQGAERLELELALAAPRSVALATLRGVASNEAREACERVRELCEKLPQTPERARTLNALGWVYYTRGEYQDSLALSRRLHEIAVAHDDAVLFVFACNLIGVTLGIMGGHEEACAWLQRGIATCERLGRSAADKSALALLVIDPEVSMRSNITVPLMHRALAEQARQHARLAMERAKETGQPISLLLAHWCNGMLQVRLDNPAKVAEHAAAITQVVLRATLAQGEGPGLWLRGWAEAALGDPRTGHRHVLEGYERHARFGMYAGCTEVLGYAVDALMVDADWTGATRQIDEALALGQKIGERSMFPNLLERRGRIAAAQGNAAAAREVLHESIAEARTQGALHYELRGLVALAELADRTDEDLDALDAAYSKLTEGFDIPLCQRVRAVLGTRNH